MRWGRLLLVPLLVLGSLAVGGSASGQVDRDCNDFAFQEDAQAFFIAQGGPASDPHRLDADNDGIACETLPRRGSRQAAVGGRTIRTPRTPRLPRTSTSQAAGGFVDRDCHDFRTQAEAQRFFEAQGAARDPHHLDADNDGLACEQLPGRVVPVARRATLPATGSASRVSGLTGSMFLAIGLTLVVATRRLRRRPSVEPRWGSDSLIGW